jgi:5-methylcytosine-specific restriction endonuclease McrA
MQTDFYKKYMQSEEWNAKKQQRIEIDKQCVMCGRPLDRIRAVQVHHITYANLGHENIYTDICTLCGTCHKRLHNYYNRIRTPQDSRLL